jgi:hypothetical protein
MRRTILAIATLAIVAPLGAQQQQGKKDAAATSLPAGWISRFDKAGGTAKFVTMGPGFHVTSGDAAVYYSAKDSASGEYTVTAKFSQSKPSGHEGYGFFIGGSSLQDPTQSYLYFLVRPADGFYMISHRAGADVHKVVEWAATPATVKQDASGNAANALSVHVTRDSVLFSANGKGVKSFSRAELRFPTAGQAGLRINHFLDVHVAEFSVKHGAKTTHLTRGVRGGDG